MVQNIAPRGFWGRLTQILYSKVPPEHLGQPSVLKKVFFWNFHNIYIEMVQNRSHVGFSESRNTKIIVNLAVLDRV